MTWCTCTGCWWGISRLSCAEPERVVCIHYMITTFNPGFGGGGDQLGTRLPLSSLIKPWYPLFVQVHMYVCVTLSVPIMYVRIMYNYTYVCKYMYVGH